MAEHKTTEEITKANLGRTLKYLKNRVAKKEEIWLDMFMGFALALVGDGEIKTVGDESMIDRASRMADMALDRYEERWGK